MGLLIFQISSIYVMIFHRSGLIPGVCLVVVSAYGAFLQIVNKKGRFQRAYLQKCTKHLIARVGLPANRGHVVELPNG